MEEFEQDWNRRRWALISKRHEGLTAEEREELEKLQNKLEELVRGELERAKGVPSKPFFRRVPWHARK